MVQITGLPLPFFGTKDDKRTETENEPVISKKLTLLFQQRRRGDFDAKGIKSHFFEQRNLRRLHDFLKVLERMDENLEHSKVQLNKRKQLLDCITTTICQDKLCSVTIDVRPRGQKKAIEFVRIKSPQQSLTKGLNRH